MLFLVFTCLSEKEELKGEGSGPFTLTQFKEYYGLNLITVRYQGMIVKKIVEKMFHVGLQFLLKTSIQELRDKFCLFQGLVRGTAETFYNKGTVSEALAAGTSQCGIRCQSNVVPNGINLKRHFC